MSETQELKSTFTLPNEIVTVRYIHRNSGMAANVAKDHVISGGMLSNAIRSFCAPVQRNNTVKNILTNEEKKYLEDITGLDLSVYGDFWSTFYVKLRKDDAGNILDLNNPMDFMALKVLESLSKDDIALNWESRYAKQTYQFAITRQNEEMAENKKKYDSKKEAFKLYGKIEDDKDKLLTVYKLLVNKPISKDTSLLWLQGKVEAIIDTEPKKFLGVVNDKAFYTKMLIQEGIDSGVILKKSNKYSTVDGLELCNPGEIATFENAVLYLDNVKNQDVRGIIEVKISKAK
jgi:hypothetical protein